MSTELIAEAILELPPGRSKPAQASPVLDREVPIELGLAELPEPIGGASPNLAARQPPADETELIRHYLLFRWNARSVVVGA